MNNERKNYAEKVVASLLNISILALGVIFVSVINYKILQKLQSIKLYETKKYIGN